MTKENNLVVVGRRAEKARLTRGKMVQRLLAGAGAAWPVVASFHLAAFDAGTQKEKCPGCTHPDGPYR